MRPMTNQAGQIAQDLDGIGRGDSTPSEAKTVLRTALKDPSNRERVYAALRDLTWRTIASRSADDEIGLWDDLIRHTAGLAMRIEESGLATRLRVLSDLVGQTARFADRQPISDVLGRKHTLDILNIVRRAGGFAKRTDIAGKVALATANLSRVLVILTSTGLLRRVASGKEALFELTDDGRRALEKAGAAAPQPKADLWWNELPVAIGIWEKDERPKASNRAMRSLVEGIDADLNWPDWKNRIESFCREEHQLPGSGSRELRTGPLSWILLHEIQGSAGRRIAMLQDMSSYKLQEMRLRQQIASLSEETTLLRAERTDIEHKAVVYQHVLQNMRESVVELAGAARQQATEAVAAIGAPMGALQHYAGGITKLSSLVPLGETQSAIEKVVGHLGALSMLVRNLAVMPFAGIVEPVEGKSSSRLEVVDLGRTIREIGSMAGVFEDMALDIHFKENQQVEIDSTFCTVLSHFVAMLYRIPAGGHQNRTQFHLKATREHGVIIVSVGPHENNSYAADFDDVLVEPAGYLFPSGAHYWKGIVEAHGGEIDIEPTTLDVTLKYPFRPLFSSISPVAKQREQDVGHRNRVRRSDMD